MQRDKSAVLEAVETGEKTVSRKSITQFKAWRFGKLLKFSFSVTIGAV